VSQVCAHFSIVPAASPMHADIFHVDSFFLKEVVYGMYSDFIFNNDLTKAYIIIYR
jgi:hypothetical protein